MTLQNYEILLGLGLFLICKYCFVYLCCRDAKFCVSTTRPCWSYSPASAMPAPRSSMWRRTAHPREGMHVCSRRRCGARDKSPVGDSSSGDVARAVGGSATRLWPAVATDERGCGGMTRVSPRQGKGIWAARTASRNPTELPAAHIPLSPPHRRPSFRETRKR